MRPPGISRTVLLGELLRPPQLHHGREGRVRALLSLKTRAYPGDGEREIPGAVLDDAHLVYCEGENAERMADVPAGALIYLEGANREQRVTDAGGKSHRLAFVSASVVRHLNNTAAAEGANVVTLVGTVAEPAVVRYASGGQCEGATLRVITTHGASEDGGEPRSHRREHHRVSFFGALAKFVAEHCETGSLVFIEGHNQPSRWQDGDGARHRTIIIVGHYFQLLSADVGHTQPPERTLEVARGYDVHLPAEETLGVA